VIGTLRRECVDHLIVLNERHASACLASSTTGTTRTECTWPYHRPKEPPELAKVVAFPVSAVCTIAIAVARPEARSPIPAPPETLSLS
jgi:hypothetical protein